jgi:very-short-patch-repair endonuclease
MEQILSKYNITYIHEKENILIRAASLALFLNIRNIRDAICKYSGDFKRTIKFDTGNGGIQETIFLTQQGLKKILCSSRKPNAVVLAKELGIETSHKTIPLETSFILNFKKAFASQKIIEQYYIDGFLVDLYLPDYNLCIEFDENKHKYNKEKDFERQAYIEKINKCSFIRVNENDDIFLIINRVLCFILENRQPSVYY